MSTKAIIGLFSVFDLTVVGNFNYHARMESSFETPVLFCIFNRPHLTEQVFAAIRERRPAKLFVAADGPRGDVPSDIDKVKACRQIVEEIDWPCEVVYRFLDENVGCKHAMAGAISWAFEYAEQLIILEDDCLPDPTFFDFCQELLVRYEEIAEVMMISGDNFQPSPRSECSYYFSRWAHIWGWATWKRAWEKFDVDVASWPNVKRAHSLSSVFSDPSELAHWSKTLDSQHAGEIDTWDFPWAYALWANNGLSILPEVNLVKNIGFGPDATHTTDPESMLSQIPAGSILTLEHPKRIAVNEEADRYTWEHVFLPGLGQLTQLQQDGSRWKSKLKSIRNWLANRSKVA